MIPGCRKFRSPNQIKNFFTKICCKKMTTISQGKNFIGFQIINFFIVILTNLDVSII